MNIDLNNILARPCQADDAAEHFEAIKESFDEVHEFLPWVHEMKYWNIEDHRRYLEKLSSENFILKNYLTTSDCYLSKYVILSLLKRCEMKRASYK